MGMVHNNVRDFNAVLTMFAKEVGYTIEYASLREAALMCRDAITFTPPYADGGGKGETKQAELVGKRAVARDLNTLFVAVNDKTKAAGAMHLNRLASSARLRQFNDFSLAHKAARESGIIFDSNVATKIVRDSDVLRAYQKAQNFFNTSSVKMGNNVVQDLAPVHRRYKYTSRQGKTKIIKNQGDYLGRFLVGSKSELNAYIKQQQNLVGKLKAGWWNVMQALPKPKKKGLEQNFGRKGVAGYVKKFPGNAIHNVYTSPSAVSIRFGNAIGNAGEKATKNNVEGLMYTAAILRMSRDMDQLLKRDANNFNNGTIR